MPRVLVNVSDVLVVRLTKFKLEVVLEVEPGAVEEGVPGAAGEAGVVDRVRPGTLRVIQMKGKANNSPILLTSVKHYKFSVLLKTVRCLSLPLPELQLQKIARK